MIHLGYETGTGKAVGIPLAHLAITGQTQQSGKTTTLEALIDRGDVRAVVFVTKPGEKSFSEGRRILPYFKERADWEYVKELLEARLNESLGSKVGYLMRACKRARTLIEVRENIDAQLPKKKASRPSMYEVLAGYIDLIIAEMERVEYTDKLDLVSGVNIMTLTGMNEEMQSLVIRSTIERIHQREHNTVLVMPEAWKFIPEGGRSPVYQALHSLIREGATNGNFVWIDAQDLAVVSKRILKSVSVWILGKQQEANEVARTINHLIEPLHIRPDMIKSLGIGQFLVCADGTTKRVYVQPRWLGELDALAIARGEESVETAQAIFRQKKRALAAELRTEPPNGKTKNKPGVVGRISQDEGKAVRVGEPVKPTGVRDDQENPRTTETQTTDAGTGRIEEADGEETTKKTNLCASVPDTEKGGNDGRSDDGRLNLGMFSSGDASRITDHESRFTEGDETMWKERAEQAETEVAELRSEVQRLNNLLLNGSRKGHPIGAVLEEHATAIAADGDKRALPSEWTMTEIYLAIRTRAINDPSVLQVITTRPELRVQVESKVLTVTESTLRGRLAMLIQKGFFKTPTTGNAAFNELQRVGRKVPKPSVYRELDNLAELGFVTKEPDGYQATGLKVTVTRD